MTSRHQCELAKKAAMYGWPDVRPRRGECPPAPSQQRWVSVSAAMRAGASGDFGRRGFAVPVGANAIGGGPTTSIGEKKKMCSRRISAPLGRLRRPDVGLLRLARYSPSYLGIGMFSRCPRLLSITLKSTGAVQLPPEGLRIDRKAGANVCLC